MNNKVAIFSDLHLGIKQDSTVWHKIAIEWCNWFVKELKKNKIKDVVFLGDFFHTRNTISANTLHVASTILEKFKNFNLHIILGNHDLYYANEPTVSPVNLFQGRNNIRVYATPEIVNFGNKSALMCGWGYNPEDYKADVLFTHAEINVFRYNMDVSTCNDGLKASGLLSNFDIVYSGHFHLRQEKAWGDKRIIYVGNTFPMDHSDNYETVKGFDIFDFDTYESTFVQNNISPKFYRVRLSELAEGKWNVEDMNGIIASNIFKIIIDRNITHQDASVLTSLVNAAKPLEFMLEWENGKNFSQDIAEVELKAFDMEDAIKKYIELLDIPNKEDITEYILRLYEKAQG
jgi:DNA repair exonuclease SbcCD nuclease subunit